ncbi:hypothetical protein Taro_008765 [Colocasia esculenta]|uniref:Uncharacterized protein n=1 Tax=Colocasia esculenta TaxID=4460 RepID=A0A843TUK8_COLES|nr:hypothetical protein [Colocasia esculenta]
MAAVARPMVTREQVLHLVLLLPLPQLLVPVFLKLPTGSKGCLEDRGTCGVAELREETPWRGVILVEARGGFGVNREIAGARLTPTPTGESEEDVSQPLSSSEPRRSGAGKISKMADRRDWGGGGDDPEESTQRMIERIWESLMDIRARMDQQAPVPPIVVPPGDGEAVLVAPVPPRVEVPFAAPVPPPPPVLIAEEPVMQVEKVTREQVLHLVLLLPLPQLLVPVFLKLPTGSKGCLEDRGMCGVSELREETPWRGAIPVEARGGFGVNWEIARGSSLYLGVCPRLLYFFLVLWKFGYVIL